MWASPVVRLLAVVLPLIFVQFKPPDPADHDGVVDPFPNPKVPTDPLEIWICTIENETPMCSHNVNDKESQHQNPTDASNLSMDAENPLLYIFLKDIYKLLSAPFFISTFSVALTLGALFRQLWHFRSKNQKCKEDESLHGGLNAADRKTFAVEDPSLKTPPNDVNTPLTSPEQGITAQKPEVKQVSASVKCASAFTWSKFDCCTPPRGSWEHITTPRPTPFLHFSEYVQRKHSVPAQDNEVFPVISPNDTGELPVTPATPREKINAFDKSNSVINLIHSEPRGRDEAIAYLSEQLTNPNMSPLHRSVLSMRLRNHHIIREETGS